MTTIAKNKTKKIAITNEKLSTGVKDDDSKIIRMPKNNPVIIDKLQWDEDGDAYLLIKLLKNRYLYDHATKDWYYWNDHYWRLDKLNHIMNMTKELIDLYGEQLVYELFAKEKAEKENNDKSVKKHKHLISKLNERIQRLSGIRRKQRILTLAATGLNSLGNTGEFWDKNPMLLTCKNGCIDLEQGEFRAGKQSDFIRTISPTDWINYDTPCPIWEKFISEMFSNDQLVIDYVQRLFGYGITGLNTEHVFPIFWGPEGRNGKSTLFDTLKHVLGEFAYRVPKGYLMDQGAKSGNSTNPDAVTAGFQGKRLAWCSETNEKDRLDVAKLKELVGGDTMTARLPYAKRPIEFDPSHLFLTITNKRPKAPANDPALWHRVHLIPLTNRFVDNPDPNKPNEFKADKKLKNKLEKEKPGILAWLVRGCIFWQEFGLNPPDSIVAATSEYQENEDILGDFIKECCICTENDSGLKISTKDLYAAYKNWCDEVGHFSMAKRNFLKDIRQRFTQVKIRGYYFFKNIDLVSDEEI